MPPRSCSSWRIVCLNAPPSVPTRLAAGTRTSVKNTSQKCRLVVMSLIGRTSMPGRVHRHDDLADARVRRAVRRRAADQVAVVGDGAEAGPDLLAVDDPVVAVAAGRRLQAGEVAAGVGLAHADAPRRLAGQDPWAGTPAAGPGGRRRSASGPSGGRRTTSRRSARRRRSAPRRRSGGRSAGGRRHRTPSATSSRSSRARPAPWRTPSSKPLIHESLCRPNRATASAATSRACSRSSTCSGVQAKSIAAIVRPICRRIIGGTVSERRDQHATLQVRYK